MTQNELQQKFKEIIDKLPEDKKKELHSKLRQMSSEERNKTIEQLVLKSEQKKAEQKQKAQEKTNSNNTNNKQKTNNQKSNNSKTNKSNTNAKSEKKTKKKQKLNSKGIKFIVGTVVTIVAITVLVVTAVNKKDSIKRLIKTISEVGTTTTETTIPTETTPETTPAPTSTPTPTPSPTPSPVPLAENAPDLSGVTVVLDPGHQEKTSEKMENYSTNSNNKKPGATSGAVGISTGICEYEYTLSESLIIKEYLEACGATVILTREENDVDLTNQERAQIATASNANVFIRIHADGANDSKTSGIRIFIPESGNFVSDSTTKGEILGASLSEAEGIEFLGVTKTQVYTGLNYATKVPAFQISLGYLTNSDDETKLQDPEIMYSIAVKLSEFVFEYK